MDPISEAVSSLEAQLVAARRSAAEANRVVRVIEKALRDLRPLLPRMETPPPSPGRRGRPRGGAVQTMLLRHASQGQFSLADLDGEIGTPESRSHTAGKLVNRGLLVRVEKGVYRTP